MTRDAKRATKRPVAHDGPRLEGTRRGKPAQDTTRAPKAVKTAVACRVRHRPVERRALPLLAACRARFDKSGLSLGDVARAAELDKSDVAKALNLREQPTARTLGRLCEYFNVASAADLNRAERKRALLVQMNAALARLVELNAAFIGELKGEE
ncbi:MAG TPA: hypothetical protein VMW93_07905 [bacterium]|nr:hypothetical protein [bacterium]